MNRHLQALGKTLLVFLASAIFVAVVALLLELLGTWFLILLAILPIFWVVYRAFYEN